MARLRRDESRALTRAKLLDAARVLMASEGYELSSVERISEEAGFSKGAFYSNFQSKEEIFLELLERHAEEDIAQLQQLLGGVTDMARMVELVSEWATFRSADPSWGILALDLFRRARHDSTFSGRHAALFNEQWQTLGRMILGCLPADQPKPADAEIVGSLVLELTYGAATGFKARVGVGDLVRLALESFFIAYGGLQRSPVATKPSRRRM